MKRLTLEESREVAVRVWGPAKSLAEDAIRALRVGVAKDVVGTGITIRELSRLATEIMKLKALDGTTGSAQPAAGSAVLRSLQGTQKDPSSPPGGHADGGAVKAPRTQRPEIEEERRWR